MNRLRLSVQKFNRSRIAFRNGSVSHSINRQMEFNIVGPFFCVCVRPYLYFSKIHADVDKSPEER